MTNRLGNPSQSSVRTTLPRAAPCNGAVMHDAGMHGAWPSPPLSSLCVSFGSLMLGWDRQALAISGKRKRNCAWLGGPVICGRVKSSASRVRWGSDESSVEIGCNAGSRRLPVSSRLVAALGSLSCQAARNPINYDQNRHKDQPSQSQRKIPKQLSRRRDAMRCGSFWVTWSSDILELGSGLDNDNEIDPVLVSKPRTKLAVGRWHRGM
jgi:hypothetical protein